MKTQPAIPIQEAQVVQEQTPEQETQALIVAETDKLIETTLAELKKSTVTDEAIAHLKAECNALSIADINDLQGYNAVKSAASKVKKIRTSIESKRKELKAPAIRFGKALDSEADRITSELKPLEDDLNKKKKDYEDAVEAAKRAEFQRRVNLLTEKGYQLINGFYVCGPVQIHSEELSKITDVQIDVYVKHGEDELQRQEAERIRKQAEAEALKAEREALEATRAEFERVRLENEKMKAELEAQRQALNQAYGHVVEPVQPVAPEPFEFAMPTAQPVHQPVAQPKPHAYTHPIVGQAVQMTPEEQAAIEAQQNVAHPATSPLTPSNEFERGFNAFRIKLDTLVKDPTVPLSRKMLLDWAWSLPFPK
jgi:hypothetical protein